MKPYKNNKVLLIHVYIIAGCPYCNSYTHILHYNKLIILTLIEIFVDTIKLALGTTGSICKAFQFLKKKKYVRLVISYFQITVNFSFWMPQKKIYTLLVMCRNGCIWDIIKKLFFEQD